MQEASFGERLQEKRLLMNLSMAELARNLNDWLAINEPDSKLAFSKSMISR
jgi:transcriptional regulator with XRE-family HTH domain